MSASTTYTALRDDTTTKSLSYNERTFLHSCATGTAPGTSSILRTDGRHPGETRPIRLSFGRAHNMSECTVQFGSSTRVSSSVTCHLIPPPHVDRPNDGSITFAVDLSPMSSMGFDYAQPSSTLTSGSGGGGMGQSQSEGQKLLTNRILRILERTLLNGGAIDAEALCVQSGKWVWRLHIDVTVLDHGGNLIDACVLSAVAAMRHFRKPEVQIVSEGSNNDENGDDKATSTAAGPSVLHSDEREPTPLPLHHTPLTITFALFADPTGATTSVSALSDPSHREELVMNGNVTFSFNKYGEMCSLDFAGGCELNPRQLKSCANLGKKKCVELCNLLEDSLAEADKKSIEERLARLKLSTGMNPNSSMPLPDISEGVPFVERTDYNRDGDMMEIDKNDLHDLGSDRANKAAAIAAAEEESYRIQALDYSLGHVAAKVKENDGGNKSKVNGNRRGGNIGVGGGSLMDAMLKSAEESVTIDEGETSSQNTAHHRGIMKYGPVIASSLKEAVSKVSGLPGQPLATDLQETNDENKNGPNNKIRSEEADLEMDQLVAEEVAKSEKKTNTTNKMFLDSDEEEETQILQSEFGSALPAKADDQEPDSKKQKSTKKKESKKEAASSMMDVDDDDLDLSAAIKKKSKKKTKKSKK